VFVYMFPTLNVMGHGSYLMGHGSHIRWVSGSWVNSSGLLPALIVRSLRTDNDDDDGDGNNNNYDTFLPLISTISRRVIQKPTRT